MKFTNKANLPKGIYDAIVNAEYDTGDADYTPSQLSTPPQIKRLMELYSKDIIVDVSDEIWKLFGTSVHYILEKAQKPKLNHYATIVWTLRSIFADPQQIKEGWHPILYAESDDNHPSRIFEKYYHAIRTNKEGTVLEPFIERLSEILYAKPPKETQNHLITEERIYMDVAGFKIGVKPDWYHYIYQKIEDYKVTSAWKVTKGDYKDWEFQLNAYRLVLEANNLPVTELQINAILKDWKKFEKGRNENYPDLPVHKISIVKWNKLDTLRKIIDRISEHEISKNLSTPELLYQTRPCTPEEKWHQDDKWAVIKEGNKKATAVFDNPKEAYDSFKDKTDALYNVELRAGKDTRCEDYCYVKQFCHQYKAEHGIPIVLEADEKETQAIVDSLPDKPSPEKTTEELFEEVAEESKLEMEKDLKKTELTEKQDDLTNFLENIHLDDDKSDFNLEDFLKE